jgi:hypothetical protein
MSARSVGAGLRRLAPRYWDANAAEKESIRTNTVIHAPGSQMKAQLLQSPAHTVRRKRQQIRAHPRERNAS